MPLPYENAMNAWMPLRPLESAEKYRLADFVLRDRSDSDIVQDIVDAFIKMRGGQ